MNPDQLWETAMNPVLYASMIPFLPSITPPVGKSGPLTILIPPTSPDRDAEYRFRTLAAIPPRAIVTSDRGYRVPDTSFRAEIDEPLRVMKEGLSLGALPARVSSSTPQSTFQLPS